MIAGEPAPASSSLRQLWAAQLPQRIERLRQRGASLARAWDVNVVRLVADDARRLAHACDSLGDKPLAEQLAALAAACLALIDPPRLPDRAGLARVAALIGQLPAPVAAGVEHADAHVAGPERELGFPLLVAPPPGHAARLRKANAATGNAATTPAAPARGVSAAPQPASTPAPAVRRFIERGAAATSREQLLRLLSECLATDDTAIRNGGLLLLVPDGSSPQVAANAAARGAEILRGLSAQAMPGEHVAADAAGRFLLLNRELDAAALARSADELRERAIRAGVGSFDIGVCSARGARNASAMLEAARRIVHAAQAQRRRGTFIVEDIDAASDNPLADLIRTALDGDGFEVLYQPIVSVRGEDGERFQALLRLRDAGGELHPASRIVPAAESAGLIGAIDRWMIGHSIERIAARGGASLRLFVSQSIASLRDPLAPARLAEALGRHSLGTDTLVIEVRATDAIEAPAEVQRYANALHELGIRLSVAGFDPEIADVHPLPTLAFDFVKIAPPPSDATPAMREAFTALIERVHERGARVIAQRIEDARSAAVLAMSGVDLIQGNFVQQADSDLAYDFGGQQM